jgi:hypothetical protein
MNNINTAVLTVLLSLTLATGCRKDDGAVNPQALEKNFASADPAVKPFADRAIAAAKTADYGAVVVELSRIANNDKLSADQQKVLRETLDKARKLLAAASPKNVDQLPMALPPPK